MTKRFLTVLVLSFLLMTIVISPILGTGGVARADQLPVTVQSDTLDPNQISGPVVWLHAMDSFVRPGSRTVFELTVKNVSDLYGLSLDLQYDASLLTLIPASATQAVATSGLYQWGMNTWDAVSGKVTLTDLMTGPVSGQNLADGKWHRLAQLEFQVAAAAGNQPFGFSLISGDVGVTAGKAMVKLSDSFGQPISFIGFGDGLNIDSDAAVVSGRITAAGSDPVQGLSDISVELMPMAAGAESLMVRTDSDGHYRCTVAPGNYKLAARTYPGDAVPYASQYYSLGGNSYNWREVTDFTLAADGTMTINLSLEPGQAISGTVTDAENETLLDQIWLHAVNSDNGFIYDICSGSTDAYGNYRLVVPVGSFYIRAQGGSMFHDAWYRVGSDEQTAIQTEASGALIEDIDIALEQRVTMVVSGTVVDADAPSNPPLGDVRVEIRSYDEPAEFVLVTQTDDSGYYQFTVPDGYGYRVLTQDYLSGNIPYAQMFYNDTGGSFSWDGATPVSVNGESISGVNFALKRSGWIEGNVTDAAGNALPSAVVAAIKPGQPELRFGSVEIGSSGHYQLVVPPGEYKVVAEPHEGPDYREVWYPNVISRDLAELVSVATGSTAASINFTVAPIVNHIAGKVLDENEDPVGWLPVCAYVVEGQSVKPFAMERTNDLGAYGIELPAGTYLIGTMARAWHQPFVDEWYDNQADSTTATRLTVSESHEDIHFSLDRLPHANVAPSCFFSDSLPASTKIELNPDELGLTEDQTIVFYEIRAWNDGSVNRAGEIIIDAGNETNVYDLPLPSNPVLPQDGVAGYDVMLYSDADGTPLAFGNPIVIFDSSYSRTLRGTVLEEGSNAPIQGVRVVAEGFDEGHIRFEALTEATGDYLLHLPGGVVEEYRISVDKKDVFPMMWYNDNGLTNQWGEATPVTVESETGTTLHLAVPAQMPSPDIGIWPRCIFDDETSTEMHVWIKPGQPGLTEAATISYSVLDKVTQMPVGISGTFNYQPTVDNYNIQLSQLNAGRYVIRFSANGKMLGDPTLMVYSAAIAGTISGRVTNGASPLIGVQVLAEGYNDSKIVFDTHTGGNGDYQLRLPAGEYRIGVQPVVEGPLVWYDNGANPVVVSASSNTTINVSLLAKTSVRAVPSRDRVALNELVTVDVTLDDITHLFGTKANLVYDPSKLEFVSYEAGNVFTGLGVINEPTNGGGNGVFRYGVVLQGQTQLVTLSEPASLCRVTFRALQAGTASVVFQQVDLDTPDGIKLRTSVDGVQHQLTPDEYTSTDALVEVVSGFSVSGYLDTEVGTPAGATVQLTSGILVFRDESVSDSGAFEITGVPDGQYEIVFEKPGFLARRATVTVNGGDIVLSGAASPIMLWPGDVSTNWGIVDFDDLLELAWWYGQGTSSAGVNKDVDFDGNGSIDFDDLLALAWRYGSTSQQYPALD